MGPVGETVAPNGALKNPRRETGGQVSAHDLFPFLGYSLVNVFQEFTERHPKPLGQSH